MGGPEGGGVAGWGFCKCGSEDAVSAVQRDCLGGDECGFSGECCCGEEERSCGCDCSSEVHVRVSDVD